jgi:ABC-type multidrug transport system fused ATPase/permease subunit
MDQHATFFRTDYSLWGIFRRFKWPIAGTFSLVVLENMAYIVQPHFIGKTVDGLVADNFSNLYIYVGVLAIFVIVSTARMIYDDRTYSAIRAQLSIETVSHHKRANSSLSETSERTALCEEILGFFESGMFVIVKSIVEIGGAMVMLAYVDARICIAAICAIIVSQMIWLSTRSRVKALFTERNNQREKKVAEIESGDSNRISNHFQKIASLKVKLSNYEAFSTGAFETIGIMVFFYAAVVATGVAGITAGELIACLAYVTSLNNATARLPGIFQAIVGVNEIAKRLQAMTSFEAAEKVS